jgi:hypothetical protein
MPTKLMPGMKVSVFQKPLTDENFEGIATLVKFKHRDDFDGTERWEVKFDDDPTTYPRIVKPENAVLQTA